MQLVLLSLIQAWTLVLTLVPTLNPTLTPTPTLTLTLTLAMDPEERIAPGPTEAQQSNHSDWVHLTTCTGRGRARVI